MVEGDTEGPRWSRPLTEQIATLRHDHQSFRTTLGLLNEEQQALEGRIAAAVTSGGETAGRVRALEQLLRDMGIAQLSQRERSSFPEMVNQWLRGQESLERHAETQAQWRRRFTIVAALVGTFYTLLLVATAVVTALKP